MYGDNNQKVQNQMEFTSIREIFISKVIKDQKLPYLILGVMIVIWFFSMVYFGTKKEGFHMDENLTYGLSNSYRKPFIYNTTEKWVSSNYINDYLTVGSNDRFKYGSVYYNQRNDVHPPLYYIMIHTISSFYIGSFSKWIGLGLNIGFGACIIIALFLLSKELLKNEWIALLVCFLWGLSIGAINSVMFIRMYVIFTLWVVISAYFHVNLVKSEDVTERQIMPIRIVTFLGCLTHYYFIIFTFFISAMYFLISFYNKRFSDMMRYLVATITSILLSIAVFPYTINHIFLGQRGTEAISNFISLSGYLKALHEYYNIINNSLFSGYIIHFMILCIIIFISTLLLHNRLVIQKLETTLSLLIVIPTFFYIIIIAKIAPYLVDRYVFPVFPLIILCFISFLYYILSSIVKDSKVVSSLLCSLSIIVILSGLKTQKINYLYTGYYNILNISEEYSDKNCLILTSTEVWKVSEQYRDIKNYQNYFIHVIYNNKLSPMKEEFFYNRGGFRDGLVVYIDSGFNQSDLLDYIKKNTNLRNCQKIFETDLYNAYIFN